MAILPSDFFRILKNNKIEFFTGVPDSLLKSFCAYVEDNVTSQNHIITANEGSAIALSIGYHLSTGKLPLVYMQNSGLGNSINPLLSLADKKVYEIPMLLLIGWRGEPGIKDEPQHIRQGEVTRELLSSIKIDTFILDKDSDITSIDKIVKKSVVRSIPTAILVRKNTFAVYKPKKRIDNSSLMNREESIHLIADMASAMNYSIISTTGVASRELYEYRLNNDQTHKSDFLTVGGMGHASQIALGIAMQKKKKNILCIDGDGAFLMHMGSIALSGTSKLKNFKHIVINNGCHDSVGGQPTKAREININGVAKSVGYNVFSSCSNLDELKKELDDFLESDGPSFLEVKTVPGFRDNLGRPKSSPLENKKCFIEHLLEK